MEKMQEIWQRILTFFENSGFNIMKVLLFFVVGVFAIRIIMKIIKRIFEKSKIEHVVYTYLLTIIKIVLFFILILTLLYNLGVDTTGLVAIFTTISLAVSLAMETIFSNLANGLIIIITKPFKEGDWISVDGFDGSVKAIKLLYTVLNTADNRDINIPNASLIGKALTNYNANPTRKVIMTFDTSYDSDVDKVKQILTDCIYSNDKAILDPAPVVRLKELKDSALSFQVIIWCKSSNYWGLYYDLVDMVFNEFKKQGIQIPYNQLEVRLLNNETKTVFRDTPIPKRTNDGTFKPVVDDKDFLDKLSDPFNISEKAEKRREEIEEHIEQKKKEKKSKKKNEKTKTQKNDDKK